MGRGPKGRAEGNIQPLLHMGSLERRKTAKSEEECFSPAEVVATGREENQRSEDFQKGAGGTENGQDQSSSAQLLWEVKGLYSRQWRFV